MKRRGSRRFDLSTFEGQTFGLQMVFKGERKCQERIDIWMGTVQVYDRLEKRWLITPLFGSFTWQRSAWRKDSPWGHCFLRIVLQFLLLTFFVVTTIFCPQPVHVLVGSYNVSWATEINHGYLKKTIHLTRKRIRRQAEHQLYWGSSKHRCLWWRDFYLLCVVSYITNSEWWRWCQHILGLV
jgi:hypothetical protein